MGLFTKTKLGSNLTKTRNNKTGKTTYSESSRMSGGRTKSRNLTTGNNRQLLGKQGSLKDYG